MEEKKITNEQSSSLHSVIRTSARLEADNISVINIIRKYLTVRGSFRRFGRIVGSHPIWFIILSLFISSFSAGMFRIVFKDNLRDGFTPLDAPAKYEMDVMREFWNKSADPMTVLVFLLAKDNGSMLRDDYLEEAGKIEKYIHSNFSVMIEGKTVVYSNFCRPYCHTNTPFIQFKENYESERTLLKSGMKLSSDIVLKYPVMKIEWGIEIPLYMTFYGIKLQESIINIEYYDKNLTKNEFDQPSYSQFLTNIQFIKVIMLVYRADKTNSSRSHILTKWQTALFTYFRRRYKSKLVEVHVFSFDIVDSEMIKNGRNMKPYFTATFGLMVLFVTLCIFLSSLFNKALDYGKILIAIGVVVCPVLSIVTSFGILSLFGIYTNSIMLLMPFLIMGTGVDNGFLMFHSWRNYSLPECSKRIRMGLVYETVGPSMTITSFTNIISFAMGVMTPTPEIKLFCMSVAIAMTLNYGYQLTFFGPILSIAIYFEKKLDIISPVMNVAVSTTNKIVETSLTHDWRQKVIDSVNSMLNVYCRIIMNRAFVVSLFLGIIGYYLFIAYGILIMKTRLDTSKILPWDSPLQKPTKIMADIIASEYYPVHVLINMDFDIRKRVQVDRLFQLITEMENFTECRGSNSTANWILAYQHWKPDFFSSFFTEKNDKSLSETNMDYPNLQYFLNFHFFWKEYIHLEKMKNGDLKNRRFYFTVVYRNMSDWNTRIKLTIQWRNIVSKYQDLNATIWEPNGMFIDQMISLKSLAAETSLYTLLCMVVVCIIFIPNICSVITASIAIASMCIGIYGCMSCWGLDLDPVTMVAILMSIGLSVDFTAHFSYYFQLSSSKELRKGKVVKILSKEVEQKLKYALRCVGMPVIQAASSTIVCILPLLFLQTYPSTVFVKTIFIIVVLGLFHGLVIVPTFLAFMPLCLTNSNCYVVICQNKCQASREDTIATVESDKPVRNSPK